MPKMVDAKKIKSAKRVLEVLEFFNEERPHGTVMEIAREYGYPQSSTSELLSCLVELGFLYRDRYARTYRPTARVAVLGSWVQPRLFRQGGLLPMMDELAEENDCTVLLGGIINLTVQVLHCSTGALPSESRAPGTAYPLLRSPIGKILLSTYDRSLIRKLVHRLNAETDENNLVRCDDLLLEIEHIRRQGFVYNAPANGEPGACAILLPGNAAHEPLSLALELKAGDQRGAEYHVRVLRSAIAAHLGPILVHSRNEFAPLHEAQ